MAAEASPHLVEVDQVQGVTVVRFKYRTILDPLAIAAVGDRLLGLAQQTGNTRFVLNFARVETVTSAVMGNFVSLRKTCEAVGGRLAFCHVDVFLQQIFTAGRLPQDIPIYPDEASAVAALQPREPPGEMEGIAPG